MVGAQLINMVELREVANQVYDIRQEGEKIGFIDAGGTTLTQITIFEEYRGNGYGHEAIELLIEDLDGRIEKLHTTTVISRKLEKILLDNGFEFSSNDADNSYVYRF